MTNGINVEKMTNWLVEKAVSGFGPLESAEGMAKQYIYDSRFKSHDEIVRSMINWETSKNFTSGFITGLGGAITLPAGVSGSLMASWLIQMRLAAAIAVVYGYDIRDERVKTMLLATLLGDGLKETLKKAGVEAGNKFGQQFVKQIPFAMIKALNKAVGFRLVTKAGEKGVVNLVKLVPLVGGMVGGCFDAATCRVTGNTANMVFAR